MAWAMLVMKTGGSSSFDAADFLHTDPCQADSFMACPFEFRGAIRSPGPANPIVTTRHPASGIGRDVAIDQFFQQRWERQDAGCNPA